MRHILTFLFALSLAAPVAAQEDIPLVPIAGVYTLNATWNVSDYKAVCFFDEDTLEVFACTNVPEPDVHPVTGDIYCTVDVTIVNPGHDINIRAYASDFSGNVSGSSPNKAVVDFTPPGAPVILP